MRSFESREDYLEAILVLQNEKGRYAALTSPQSWGLQSPV